MEEGGGGGEGGRGVRVVAVGIFVDMFLTVLFARIAFGLLERGAVQPFELQLELKLDDAVEVALALALALEDAVSGWIADTGG